MMLPSLNQQVIIPMGIILGCLTASNICDMCLLTDTYELINPGSGTTLQVNSFNNIDHTITLNANSAQSSQITIDLDRKFMGRIYSSTNTITLYFGPSFYISTCTNCYYRYIVSGTCCTWYNALLSGRLYTEDNVTCFTPNRFTGSATTSFAGSDYIDEVPCLP
mgnify:CR=1 FL=1